jgi:hypothetical protein
VGRKRPRQLSTKVFVQDPPAKEEIDPTVWDMVVKHQQKHDSVGDARPQPSYSKDNIPPRHEATHGRHSMFTECSRSKSRGPEAQSLNDTRVDLRKVMLITDNSTELDYHFRLE